MPFWKTFDTASLMERKILPQIDFVATISTTTTLKDDVLGLSKLYSVTSGSMLSSLHVLWVIHSFFWTKSIFDASQETIKKSAYSSSLLTLFVKRKGGEIQKSRTGKGELSNFCLIMVVVMLLFYYGWKDNIIWLM